MPRRRRRQLQLSQTDR